MILQAKCEGNRIVARKLHIIEKQIRQWRKQKGCIQKEMNDGCSRKKRKRLRGGGQKAAHYDVESSLADWVTERKTSTGHTTINSIAGKTDDTGSRF